MAISPDTKNWTWVVERACPECGFDASSLSGDQVAPLIRTNAVAWQSILVEPLALLRRRTSEDRWSPLEYCCHVRDVFRIYDYRLRLMLAEDNPTYPNWDQDRSAIDDRYNEQDAAVVSSELASAADVLATTFDAVDGTMWDRRGSRSDGSNFTVDTFARYLIHDPVHHLHDVTVDLPVLKS